MASNNYASSNSYFGLAVETIRGTAASISTFTPVTEPKLEAKLTWLDDSALRGSPTMNYDQVPGVRHDEWTGKTYIYWDVFPNLVRAALGSSDTVASVGPSLWTHTIGLFNSPNLGSQPPSYTLVNYSVDNTYQMTAGQLSDLTVTLGADAAAEATPTFITNAYTTVASVAVNESTAHMVPAWNTTASVGGISVDTIENFEINIKRGTLPIHTLGTQGPYKNFAGPLEVSGKATFVIEAGTSSNYITDALTRDQLQVILQMADPVTNYFQRFTMDAVQFEEPVITVGKSYLTLESNYKAVANTTDQVTGGYSSVFFVASNNISSAY